MFVLKNMWFQTLMRQFFFNIDKIVYNFISTLYDLLISIARTSILSQADILNMAERIYELLAVFMIFKVTFSLIMYTVNPDDFSDKTKGVGKLGTNIIISLALLVLTPYVFNLAYRVQTIILEDNSLAALIFGDETSTSEENPINTAGDTMAFVVMSPFFAPNMAIEQLEECVDLMSDNSFNQECSGLDENYEPLEDPKSLYALTRKNINVLDVDAAENDDFQLNTLKNYVAGVNNGNLGLMFRQDMAIAISPVVDSEYIIEYKYVFSTILGVVIILLLLTFCMDVALRSVKLAFLQLIAPIPIISYVDPKSGKDGMFKKWYEMCFKTYISLFVRLLALYFVVYIVSRLDTMTDIVDGTYVTNMYIKIFVVIGALMFAKQLPKILEGLGIKLDGDGKFTLNPLKKFEEQAIGGKNITGLARGGLMGLAGAASGAGIGRAFTGAWRGLTAGKGWSETGKLEAEMNRKMRQARLDGSTFGGRMGARFAGAVGLPGAGERLSQQDKDLENQIKQQEELHQSFDSIKSKISGAIESQKLGSYSDKYNELKKNLEVAKTMKDSIKREDFRSDAAYKSAVDSAAGDLIAAENAIAKYLKKDAIEDYYNAYRAGSLAESEKISEISNAFDKYDAEARANNISSSEISNYASAKLSDEKVSNKISELQNDRIEIRDQMKKANADETAIK